MHVLSSRIGIIVKDDNFHFQVGFNFPVPVVRFGLFSKKTLR